MGKETGNKQRTNIGFDSYKTVYLRFQKNGLFLLIRWQKNLSHLPNCSISWIQIYLKASSNFAESLYRLMRNWLVKSVPAR